MTATTATSSTISVTAITTTALTPKEMHTIQRCPSPSCCRTCGARYNTLIYEGIGKCSEIEPISGVPTKVARQRTTAPRIFSQVQSTAPWLAVLSTALLTIGDGRQRIDKVHIRLDPCSEVTLINMNLACKLGDRLTKIDIGIAADGRKLVDSASARIYICTVYK